MLETVATEVIWANLLTIVNEQARAMQRTAFSPIVRDVGDLAYALFDARGRMVAQAETGTPGHINCLARTAMYLAEEFSGSLQNGDVIITNDPWLGAGHLFDIIAFSPVFSRAGKLIGFVGSNNHHTDIGGSGIGPGASDVHEEGLWIPPSKLYEAGKRNEQLHTLIRRNVRTPDLVSGDLAAQVSANRAGADALVALCESQEIEGIEAVSDEILQRSEQAMRNSIKALPAGTWQATSHFDIPGGQVIHLAVKLTVDNVEGEVLIDFEGSSPEVTRGINVVLAYTQAYSMFAVRACINPTLPNNWGSLVPIKVTAPEGSIVNCRYPAPVAARHIVGMYVPMPILKALYNVVPDKVLAESPGGAWGAQVIGRHENGDRFISTIFAFAGGMGARSDKNGPDATFYPTGIAATPVEVIEAGSPVRILRKEIRAGSGGKGRQTGGNGQIVEFTVNTGHSWVVNALSSGLQIGASGFDGGGDGEPGALFVNGKRSDIAGKLTLQPGDVVRMETPGGGGYGQP